MISDVSVRLLYVLCLDLNQFAILGRRVRERGVESRRVRVEFNNKHNNNNNNIPQLNTL